MLTKEQNDLICSVGPDTPGGDWFRRYWVAAGYSADFKPGGQPKRVRLLGEDLVMFRDVDGRMGLLGLRCSHRLTSLAYGRVEDGGLRCPFHGWVYDIDGRCLEQPAEPKGSTFKDRIRHPSYPCEELGGVVFTYMGPPDKRPAFPRKEGQIIPTYSNHTVIPIPKAPTPEAEEQLLRDTGCHVAEGYLEDHASLVDHLA